MRWWLHDLLRRHYYLAQGTTEFHICVPRVAWLQRPTEYVVAMAGLDPVAVTREQFVNLDRRLRAEGAASLDELEREEDYDD